MSRLNAIMVEVCILMVWHRVLLVFPFLTAGVNVKDYTLELHSNMLTHILILVFRSCCE